MSDSERLKPFPSFPSDEDAERFVEEADLADYDLSGFRSAKIRIGSEPVHLDVFLSATLLAAVELKANARGISSQRLIEDAIERELAQSV